MIGRDAECAPLCCFSLCFLPSSLPFCCCDRFAPQVVAAAVGSSSAGPQVVLVLLVAAAVAGCRSRHGTCQPSVTLDWVLEGPTGQQQQSRHRGPLWLCLWQHLWLHLLRRPLLRRPQVCVLLVVVALAALPVAAVGMVAAMRARVGCMEHRAAGMLAAAAVRLLLVAAAGL